MYRINNIIVKTILFDTNLRFAGLNVLPEDNYAKMGKSGIKIDIVFTAYKDYKIDVQTLKRIFKANNINSLAIGKLEITYKVENNKEYFIFNTPDGNVIDLGISTRFRHPLQEKYGINGLSLKCVAYRDKHILHNYNFKKEDLLRCTVDYVVFNIMKDNKPVDELKLTAKELFRYIVVKRKIENNNIYDYEGMYTYENESDFQEDKQFLENSGLVNFEFVNMEINYKQILDKYEAQLKNPNHYELIEATKDYNKIQNWENKLALISDGKLKYDKSSLTDCDLTNIETLNVPDFLYIKPFAFIKSTVKEMILTSPETIVLPTNKIKTTNMFIGNGYYSNTYHKQIKVLESYDTVLSKPLFPYELNGIQQYMLMCMLQRGGNGDNIVPCNIDNERFEV